MSARRPLIASAMLLGLAACSVAPVSSPSPDGPPVFDGTFTLYAGRAEDLIAPLIADFEDETGIEVAVRYAGTTELAALLQEEGSATPADVFLSQDAGALGAVSGEGLFAVLPDSVTAKIPAAYTSRDNTWVGITGRARVIAYDGKSLTPDEAPESVLDLVDPRWRGQVGIAPTNASFQSFVTALRVLEGEDAARAWLEAMIANDVQIYPNNGAIRDAVDSGEIQLGLINHYYWYQKAAEVGADALRVQLSFPAAGDAGGIVNVTGAGLLSAAGNDGDALAFLAYLVSEKGQQYFVEKTYEYPLLPGVAAPDGLPPLESLTNPNLDLSDLDDLAGTTALLASVGLL